MYKAWSTSVFPRHVPHPLQSRCIGLTRMVIQSARVMAVQISLFGEEEWFRWVCCSDSSVGSAHFHVHVDDSSGVEHDTFTWVDTKEHSDAEFLMISFLGGEKWLFMVRWDDPEIPSQSVMTALSQVSLAPHPSQAFSLGCMGEEPSDCIICYTPQSLPWYTSLKKKWKDRISSIRAEVHLHMITIFLSLGKNFMTNELYDLSGNTGSLRYMAPEVGLEKFYNHKVDVYSFGLLLWQVNNSSYLATWNKSPFLLFW